jgi:hypothetical protein
MKALIRQRERKLARLHELAPSILFGSASETYRTCGNRNCRCHGEGPKHGPHMYVNYKGEDGRTTGYYVPKALQETVRHGLAAWREFHALAKEIAQLNQQIVDAERPKKKRSAPRS